MTEKEAKAAKLQPLTENERPSFVIQTAYGEMLWSEWCKREVQRLKDAGRTAEIVQNATTWAVWVSPPLIPFTRPPLPLAPPAPGTDSTAQ